MERTLVGELKAFCGGTSIKGLSRMIHAEVSIVKMFWAAAVVTCFAIMMVQVVTVVITYCSFQTIANVEIFRTTPIFPDVTICNLFQIESHASGDWERFNARVNDSNDLTESDKLALQDPLSYPPNTKHFNYTDEDSNEMIVDCQTYGWDLNYWTNCKKITSFFSPLFRKCHTITSPSNITALDLILHTDNFFPYPINFVSPWVNLPRSLGAKIMIHPKSTYPSLNAGIDVSPGNEARIMLTQNNITRLPRPYGNCTEKIKLDITAEKGPTLYSTRACLSSCRQRQVISECGCHDSSELFIPAEVDLIKYRSCMNITKYLENIESDNNPYIDDVTEMRCYYYNSVIDYFACDCQPPCSETEYDIRTSTARWPSPLLYMWFYSTYIKNKSYSDQFDAYRDIERKFQNNTGEALKEIRKLNLIEENFIKIVVMFENLEVTKITERPSITWDTMASNLGGSFNLWLGISIVTVAELLELVYTLVSIKLKQTTKDPPDKIYIVENFENEY